ncbi:MAG: hypothetical protein Q8K24_05850 [Hydrogenophaga sp.]|nr:hypothetical protein [Hydrogenophaga sp.]
MKAYIHTCCTRADGTRDSFATIAVDVKRQELPWQKMGLSFTASGYGARVPTPYMVRFNDKWRRVYCRIYSNIGTLFIGKLSDNLIVNIDSE